MEEFIMNFANQFDDTDAGEFTADTSFRDLGEWSSLIGLAIMNMVQKKYGKTLTAAQLRSCNTIEDVFRITSVS